MEITISDKKNSVLLNNSFFLLCFMSKSKSHENVIIATKIKIIDNHPKKFKP